MQKISEKNRYINTKLTLGVEIDNYQWKVLLLNISQIQLILVTTKNSVFHSYISDKNEQYGM